MTETQSPYSTNAPPPKPPQRLHRYHIEIDKDPNYVRLQNRANAYLEECAELGVHIHSTALQWMDDEYHLTIVLRVPLGGDGSTQ